MSGYGPGQRLTQPVTYWSPKARRNPYNEFSFNDPVLLLGFWSDIFEERVTSGGQTIMTKAVVHVNKDVLIDGWLAQGDYSLSGVTDPTKFKTVDAVNCYEIKDFFRRTDLRNMDYDRIAIL